MEELIQLVLDRSIVGTNFKEPITFKSGIKAPIYCNFRKSTAFADLLNLIIYKLKEKIANLDVDCIAGVATGAIAYSAICARDLSLPSCYVRPDAKAKGYGLKQLIEGCDVSGKKVALIEDLVSTSESIVENAKILKQCGAEKVELISIFSYEMKRSKKELAEANFTLSPIITIHDLLPELKKKLSIRDYMSLVDWVRDPEGWFDRHKLEFDFGFLTQLRQSSKDSGSIICMGHDPVLEALPEGFHGIDGYVDYMDIVFTEMVNNKLSPGAFKPNLAWWVIYDEPWEGNHVGSDALIRLMEKIQFYFSGMPIILDNKTGDIGTSSTKWAQYGLKNWNAGAVTVHSYMGSDSISPYAEYCSKEKGKGAYLLVKTTNKGAVDLELKKMNDGRMVYEHTADNVINWAKGKPGLGAVTAGNSPENLYTLGGVFAGKDIPLLIPGVGPSQGGDAAQVATILQESGYESGLARINLSSGLTHPWYKEGQPNPPTEECVSIIIETLRSLNEKVSYVG